MENIVLFNKSGIKVELKSLKYNSDIEGCVTEVKVSNSTDYILEIQLSDIFKDDILRYTCWSFINKPILPHSDEDYKLIDVCVEHAESDEGTDCLSTFYNGYTKNYSFRIKVYKKETQKASNTFDEYIGWEKGPKIQLNGLSMEDVVVYSEDDFLIVNDGRSVCATSDYCIPFELSANIDERKKEQILRFESELRSNIISLNYIDVRSEEILKQEVLVCGYSEKSYDFFDIENRCIYNIGTSTFTECCPDDIAFITLDSDMIKCRFDIENNKKYNYIYSLFYKGDLEKMLSEKNVLVQWDNINIDMSVSHSPERYWRSIRKNIDFVRIDTDIKKSKDMFIGIKVELHVPRTVLPASVMKALIDGIVCAFHKEDNIEELSDIMDIKSLALTNDAMNIFGNRKYVFPFRDGKKWNPADEMVLFAWVSVIKEDCEPYISGKIYEF